MNGREWTTEDKSTLRRLARFKTATAIAVDMNRTPTAVRGMARKMGIDLRKRGEVHQRTKYSDERIKELRDLHGTGKWSPRTLAKKFAMPLGTVQAIVYRQVRL